MEKIITNTGLQHLAENVFWNLHIKDLKICAQINQSCKQILQNPFYYLRKFEHLSKENRKDWIKGIQSVKKSDHHFLSKMEFQERHLCGFAILCQYLC